MADTDDSTDPRSLSPSSLRRRALPALIAVVAGAVSVWVVFAFRPPEWTEPVKGPDSVVLRPAGGSVRVAVATPPEPSDQSVGGATLRQLTLPQLFVAQPDGTWRSSLVQPRSDRAERDGMSASFELRPARWSNGVPVSVDDLRRSADPRFVSSVSDPDDEGRITVRFTQKFPAWRNLWSGTSFIEPPVPDASAGPFKVASIKSGLGVNLVRNDAWFGGRASLDEVRLLVVPQADMARELLRNGAVDVVQPAPDTSRTQKWSAVPGVEVRVREQGGWWAALRVSRSLTQERREALASAVPNEAFTETLLRNEAEPLRSLSSGDPLSGAVSSGGRLDGFPLRFAAPAEEPLSPTLRRMVQNAVASRGGGFSGGEVPASEVRRAQAAGQWDVVLDGGQTGPDVCWQCTLGFVDPALAEKADTGDSDSAESLQRKARSSGEVIPLWRSYTVTAARVGTVSGVVPNGYAPGVAWNAGSWWRP